MSTTEGSIYPLLFVVILKVLYGFGNILELLKAASTFKFFNENQIFDIKESRFETHFISYTFFSGNMLL